MSKKLCNECSEEHLAYLDEIIDEDNKINTKFYECSKCDATFSIDANGKIKKVGSIDASEILIPISETLGIDYNSLSEKEKDDLFTLWLDAQDLFPRVKKFMDKISSNNFENILKNFRSDSR